MTGALRGIPRSLIACRGMWAPEGLTGKRHPPKLVRLPGDVGSSGLGWQDASPGACSSAGGCRPRRTQSCQVHPPEPVPRPGDALPEGLRIASYIPRSPFPARGMFSPTGRLSKPHPPEPIPCPRDALPAEFNYLQAPFPQKLESLKASSPPHTRKNPGEHRSPGHPGHISPLIPDRNHTGQKHHEHHPAPAHTLTLLHRLRSRLPPRPESTGSPRASSPRSTTPCSQASAPARPARRASPMQGNTR